MKKVYAYLDIDHPIVAWGAYRGVLISSNAEQSPPNCPVSMMLAGIVLYQNNARLSNELIIEKWRQDNFPDLPSRLTGMYFFETKRDAELVNDWGEHFSPEYLAEIELYSTSKVSKHDSNWITFAPLDEKGRLTDTSWINKYWLGLEYPKKIPVWELIAHGRAAICGTALREQAYRNLVKEFPETVAILEVSRVAATLGSDLGQSSAWITKKEDDLLELSFYLDMRDADNSEFLERLSLYRGPKNYEDLAVGGDMFAVPDFRPYSCTFSVTMGLSKDENLSMHINETEI